jgi:hypothetical protein
VEFRVGKQSGLGILALFSDDGAMSAGAGRGRRAAKGGCRHPRSELDAEVAPCSSSSWVVEVVGGVHRVVWGAELVAEGGGELSFGSWLAGECDDGAVEVLVGYVVAVGPVVPGGEAADVEPVFADGGEHGVEAVADVVVAELVVGLALGGKRHGVLLNGGAGSLPSAGEVVLGSYELLFGLVQLVAEGAAVPAGGAVESMLRGGPASTALDGARFGMVQDVSIGGGGGVNRCVHGVGVGDVGGDVGPLR